MKIDYSYFTALTDNESGILPGFVEGWGSRLTLKVSKSSVEGGTLLKKHKLFLRYFVTIFVNQREKKILA